MIIDAHAHACGPFLRSGSLVEVLDRHGVDMVALVPGEPDSEKVYDLPNIGERFPKRDILVGVNRLIRTTTWLTRMARHVPQGNDHVYALARQHPDRVLPFHWILLSRFGGEEDLDCLYRKRRFLGLKLHQCWESFRVASDEFEQLASWATRAGLPIFVHLYSHSEVKQLVEYVRRNPRLKIIVGHLFGLELFIHSGIRSENVFFEISTPPLISLHRVLKAVETFGARQIVMGSDTPYGRDSLNVNVQRVRELPLAKDDKALILGGNMQRLLSLS